MEKQKLSYSILIYVLSILGLPLCFCFGFGIIPSGIAFFIARHELKKHYANPDMYSNKDDIYTGKIIALVVVIINILFILYVVYSIYTIGWDNIVEQSRQTVEQYQQTR